MKQKAIRVARWRWGAGRRGEEFPSIKAALACPTPPYCVCESVCLFRVKASPPRFPCPSITLMTEHPGGVGAPHPHHLRLTYSCLQLLSTPVDSIGSVYQSDTILLYRYWLFTIKSGGTRLVLGKSIRL